MNSNFIHVNIDKYRYSVPLLEENHKVIFKAKESFTAGVGILRCYSSGFILERVNVVFDNSAKAISRGLVTFGRRVVI